MLPATPGREITAGKASVIASGREITAGKVSRRYFTTKGLTKILAGNENRGKTWTKRCWSIS